LFSIKQELILDQELETSKVVKKAKRSLNSRYTKLKLRSFLQDRFLAEDKQEEGKQRRKEKKEKKEEKEDTSLDTEESLAASSIGSSNSSSTAGSVSSDSSERSLESAGPDSDFNQLLKEARFAERSFGKRSLYIKKKLLSLLLLFFKQDTGLYSFSFPIYSFFAYKSIRPNLSFKDFLEFLQYYSAFLYYSQLAVIEYSFQEAFRADNSLSFYSTIKGFISSYFNNSIFFCLLIIPDIFG
jgi:hypothetical protein